MIGTRKNEEFNKDPKAGRNEEKIMDIKKVTSTM